MVEQEHVQIAVAVIVEEQRLGRIALEVEAVLLRLVAERPVVVVDVEHVPAVDAEVIDATHVEIHVAVAVDVGRGDAGLPADRIGDAGALGHVLEAVVALVQIEAIRAAVGREVEVGEPVVVDVSDRDAAAVVVVEVVQDVERGVFGERVGEADPRAARAQRLEEWLRPMLAADESDGGTKEDSS